MCLTAICEADFLKILQIVRKTGKVVVAKRHWLSLRKDRVASDITNWGVGHVFGPTPQYYFLWLLLVSFKGGIHGGGGFASVTHGKDYRCTTAYDISSGIYIREG